MQNLIEAALANAKQMPFWLDDPAAPDPEPALCGTIKADLAIVGGGFTGLWAAIQAKEADPSLDVVIVEADRVAFGASGRPGGIISTSVMHGLKNENKFFPGDVEILERLGQENLDAFKDTVERHNIDADLEWTGEMTVAVKLEDIDELREEFELHRRYGHDVRFLDRDETRAQLDSAQFLAGMWSRNRSGIVHPAKLAWGLKKAILALGVRIYEKTPLLDLEDRGDHLAIHTPEGEVVARRVLLATNAFTAGDRRIKRRVMAMRDHVLATAPLTDEQLARIGWANRQGIYDTGTELNYFRLTRDNRIVFGGSVSYHYAGSTAPPPEASTQSFRNLVSFFYGKFPQLKDVAITHLWGGPIDYCTRFAMFFEPYHGGKAYYVGGYSGFGVAGSRFGARIGVALLQGQDLPELKLDMVRRRPNILPPEPFRWIGAKITFHAMKGVDEKGGWRKLWLGLLDKLGYPMG